MSCVGENEMLPGHTVMVVEIDSVGLDRILAFDGEHFDGKLYPSAARCWAGRWVACHHEFCSHH